MSYRRRLSPYERLWIAAQTSCGFTMVEGQGKLSAQKLRAAVDIATAANPGSRLTLKGIGPWSYWEESAVPPSIEEVDGSDWDGWSMDGAPFSDQAHMDPKASPSTSYVLIHGPTTRLVQRTHHATMDGLGALTYLQDVFRALRGEAVIGASGTETDLDLARRLGGRKHQIDFNCLKPFASASTGISGSTWDRVRVNGKMKPQPLATLIHIISKIARDSGEGQVLIDLPVNMRAQFPEIRNTGNLTGSLRLTVDATDSIDAIAKGIEQNVSAGRHADALISAIPFLYMPIWLMRSVARSKARQAVLKDQFAPTAVVSNLGRIDTAALSSAEFQAESAIIIPPAYDGVPLFLVISGHARGFDVSARAPVALASEGRLRVLLQQIAEQLAAA